MTVEFTGSGSSPESGAEPEEVPARIEAPVVDLADLARSGADPARAVEGPARAWLEAYHAQVRFWIGRDLPRVAREDTPGAALYGARLRRARLIQLAGPGVRSGAMGPVTPLLAPGTSAPGRAVGIALCFPDLTADGRSARARFQVLADGEDAGLDEGAPGAPDAVPDDAGDDPDDERLWLEVLCEAAAYWVRLERGLGVVA